ncbi:M23 family metallopeptidase [Sorangium sp. So ce513]|uniref:M23 family metallopeptidase n=1 Tax=Sorangium sp. So ce513 TaxID=3133315 RepID=UPI003F5F5758
MRGGSPKRPEPTSDGWSPRTEASVWLGLGLLAVGVVWFTVRAVEIDRSLGPASRQLASAAPPEASPPPPPPAPDAGAERHLALAWTVGAPGEPAGPLASVRRSAEELLARRLPRGLRRGAVIRAVAEPAAAPKEPRVLALDVRAPGQPRARFYRFGGSGTRRLVDEDGREPVPNPWQAPLATLRRTSPFNPKRMHPVLHRVRPHEGTDYGAPTGTPVYAALEGTVSWVGPHGGHGNWVAIKHDNGIETGYAHLSRFAAGLKRGDHVATHQLIGYVGSTGRSTGPHLHFSASRNGVYFDAETLLATRLRELPAEERDAFRAEKGELDRELDDIGDPLPAASRPGVGDEPASPADDPVSQPRAAASGARRQRR